MTLDFEVPLILAVLLVAPVLIGALSARLLRLVALAALVTGIVFAWPLSFIQGFLARANDERVKLTELGLAYRARTIEETKCAIPWQRTNVERVNEEIARRFSDEWARLARNSEKDLVELRAAIDAS